MLSLIARGSLLFPPRLEHQHIPQMKLLVALAFEMLLPLGADQGGVEVTVVPEAVLVEEAFRPIAQRAAQPGGDGDLETISGRSISSRET